MALGSFAFLLHGHLPFVRHPDDPFFIEELWYYEAVAETYLPLLKRGYALREESIAFPLQLSLSPPLLYMMADELLSVRFERYLENHIELAAKEKARNKHNSSLLELSDFYHNFYQKIYDFYTGTLKRDIINGFRELAASGTIQLWSTSATHCFLPLFQHQPKIVKAQLKVALDSFRDFFGMEPCGFWLSECGYYSGLDALMKDVGIDLTILESHSLLFGNPRPPGSVYLPVHTKRDLTVFARDLLVAQQIWSSESGYPGDPFYREFYSDIAYDRTPEELAPCVHPAGFIMHTGMKYRRITDKLSSEKAWYEPLAAQKQTRIHAHDFLNKIVYHLDQLSAVIRTSPIISAPFDAELFGHWWFEGPDFLDQVARIAHRDKLPVNFTFFNDYLKQYPTTQVCEPAASSWGKNGYNEVWLNHTNDWIYPLLHQAGTIMLNLANHYANLAVEPLSERILNQMSRELLLAQASDWPFMIRMQTTAQYAQSRLKEHLNAFHQFVGMLQSQPGQERRNFLEERERQYTLFPAIDFRIYGDPL